MNFTEAFETLARLYESVSPKNPFLAKALSLYSKDTAAKGVIVSIRKDGSGTKEEEVGKLYHSTAEFDKIMAEIYKVHGTDINVSAIHDRDMIKTYEIELEKNSQRICTRRRKSSRGSSKRTTGKTSNHR